MHTYKHRGRHTQNNTPIEKSKNPNMQTQSALFNISHKTPRQTHSCTYTTHTDIHSNRYPCRGTIQDTATQLSLLTIGHKDTHYCEDTLTTRVRKHTDTHMPHINTLKGIDTQPAFLHSLRDVKVHKLVYTCTQTHTHLHRHTEQQKHCQGHSHTASYSYT